MSPASEGDICCSPKKNHTSYITQKKIRNWNITQRRLKISRQCTVMQAKKFHQKSDFTAED
jgi:hypothetical protein